MKDLLGKLSTYNLFNYLFPGILFSVLGDKLTTITFIYEDIVTGVFVYYFVGLVISRIGSLFVEPILKKLKFVKFAPYPDFVKASTIDDKIEIFSEVNNMYRTLSSLFVCLIILKVFDIAMMKISLVSDNLLVVSILLLVFLFLFSYQKQSNYITERVNSVAHSSDTHDE